MKKKRMSREQHIEMLARTDENFRRLTEIVKRHNGGRIPSAEEMDDHFQGWFERQERRTSS